MQCLCGCVRVYHGSVPAFMCWKSNKRDCTSCDTHTLTAISHYTTPAVKLNACVCVCVCVIECQRADWKKRERVIYSERQRRSSLLISHPSRFPPFMPLIRSFLMFHHPYITMCIHLLLLLPQSIRLFLLWLRITRPTAKYWLFWFSQAYFSDIFTLCSVVGWRDEDKKRGVVFWLDLFVVFLFFCAVLWVFF